MNPDEFARRADAVIGADVAAAGTTDDTAEKAMDEAGDHPSEGAPDRDDPVADRDHTELPLLRGERGAGRLLTRLVVTAGLVTALVAGSAAALAWQGLWDPLVAFVVLIVMAAVSWRISALVPARALPVWSAIALTAISLAAATWAGMTHDEQLLPRSEAAVNAQAAISLAEHHQWPIPLSANDIGAPEVSHSAGVTMNSRGFRQVGSAAEPRVEPLVLNGTPAWLTLGFWVGGVAGMLWVPAMFGGLAVLAIGLLTSSIVGPRWGPLAALSAAICYPLLHAARATLADIIVVFVLSAGLLILVAATRAGARGRWQQARLVGALAGAMVASGSFFRLDALGETVALLPVAALLIIRRDGAGPPVLWGAGVATLLSAAASLGLSGDVVQVERSLLIALGLLAAGLTAVVLVLVAVARRGGHLPDGIRSRLPMATAACAAIGGLCLLVLPSRQALIWTSWWTGPWSLGIGLLVVVAAANQLAGQWVRGERLPGWTGAVAVGLAATALRWFGRSGDQSTPWVGGGLVVAVPLFIVCAAMAAALVTRWTTRHLPTAAAVVASLGTVAILLVPEAVATVPHAHERLSEGQLRAVRQVCRAFRPADVALMIDDRASDEWLPTVGANCHVPALSLSPATRHDPGSRASAIASVAQSVSARGGRLVIMAAGSVAAIDDSASALAAMSRATHKNVPRIGKAGVAVDISVTQDPVQVDGRPDELSRFPVQVWLAAAG